MSHYVRAGSPLDLIARARATSVYLVPEVVPMLPSILSETLCSLNAHVDRFSFSVIWELTPEGEIVSTWFGKTIIQSRAQLSYENAQEAIDAESAEAAADALLPKCRDRADALTLAHSIRALHRLAVPMRKRRCASLPSSRHTNHEMNSL